MMKQQEKRRSGYQKKLEPRSVRMILIGYERDFTYRLFNPEDESIVLTREVIFDELTFIGSEISGSYQSLDEVIDTCWK